MAHHQRTKPDVSTEFTSKALGNYPPGFCKVIAEATSKVNMERAMRVRELREQDLPWPQYTGRWAQEEGGRGRSRTRGHEAACQRQRQPANARGRLPQSAELGGFVRELIKSAVAKHPSLCGPAKDILNQTQTGH